MCYIFSNKGVRDQYLDDPGVIPEVQEGEAAMDAVEGDPDTEADAPPNIAARQLATECRLLEPLERGFGD